MCMQAVWVLFLQADVWRGHAFNVIVVAIEVFIARNGQEKKKKIIDVILQFCNNCPFFRDQVVYSHSFSSKEVVSNSTAIFIISVRKCKLKH